MALFSSWKVDTLVLLTGLLTLAYIYIKRIYSYWERKGFKTFPNFNYIVGHFTPTFTQKEGFGDLIGRIYNSTTEPYVGIYSVLRPILVVCDPELVRTILVKDFQHFTDRGVHCEPDYDPLSGHLFSLPGKPWKNLRGKLSPTFTSGKLKSMFSTLVECGSNLQNHLEDLVSKNQLLDVREIAASHSTNVISSVAFGIEVDAIKDPNNEFRVCGRKIFESSLRNAARWLLMFIAPSVMRLFRLKVVDDSVEKFIKSVVKENMEHREKNNVSRKDFFQLLIQLRNTGTVQLDDQWDTVIKADESQKTLSLNEMAAQTFVFFAAGFGKHLVSLRFLLTSINLELPIS